jgi:hypothetical protein
MTKRQKAWFRSLDALTSGTPRVESRLAQAAVRARGRAGDEGSNRRVDGALLLIAGHEPRRAVGRYKANIMCGQRDIDEHAALRAVEPAERELR